MTSYRGRVELPEGEPMRVDRYIARRCGLLSRSQFKQQSLFIKVNGREVKPSRRVCRGDLLELSYAPPPAMLPGGEDIPLTVLYEDSQVLVADKPAGMVVHPGAGNFSGTLVHALLFRIGGWPESEGASASGLRPGIVHRLDKDTSGVIITAKNPRAQEFLAAQFRERRVKKEYLAVVKGRLYPLTGRISSYLIRDSGNRKKFTWNGEGRGRLAVTAYRVLKVFENHSLVLLRPRTGRTHQLRVHMLSLGHPIAGDPLYSRPGGEAKSLPQGLMLHARRLSLLLPGETGERTFQAPLPERFKQYLSELRSAGL